MRTQALGIFTVGLLALCGCANQPVNTEVAASQPIGSSFTFDRYSYPAYYQFVLAKNKGGKLELCGASIIVEDIRRPDPTPYMGEAEFSGGVEIKLDFIKRYFVLRSSDLGQALMRVNSNSAVPASLRSGLADLPANCVVTQVTWRDDLRDPTLTGDDWTFLTQTVPPQSGYIAAVPKPIQDFGY